MIMNVQKMYTKFLHIDKKFTNCTKLAQSSDKKRFETACTFFVHSNNVQTIQNLYN